MHEFTFLCVVSRKNLPEIIDRAAGHAGIGKFPYQFLPGRMREVDRNRALVAIGGQKIGGLTLAIALEPGWTPCAGIVAAPGTLYLDDICTVVAE
jgi:hypothetical protein